MKFLYFLLLIISINTTAQTADTLWKDGSAKQLKGKAFNICLFVSQGKKSWTEEEKAIVIYKMHEACNWLQEQAKTYNVKVNFYDTALAKDADIKMDELYIHEEGKKGNVDFKYKIMKAAGHENQLAYYDSMLAYTHCDNINLLFFVKAKGRSHASLYKIGTNKQRNYFEAVTLYKENTNGSDIFSGTIAHEILHLYGAWDLYQSYKQQKGVLSKSESILRHSIMLHDQQTIDNVMVDEVNAYNIGWFNTYYKYYENFRPTDR